MAAQRVDLYQPMLAVRPGPAPVELRVGVMPNQGLMEGGAPAGASKIETYVLLSALPTELQERVKLAVQALIAGR